MIWFLPVAVVAAVGGGIVYLVKKKKDEAKELPPTTDPNAPSKLPTVKPKAPKVPPGIETQPYQVVVVPDGRVRLRITNAFGMYSWAVKTAAENGATPTSNAEDVLRSLAASLPGAGTGITEVQVVEKGVQHGNVEQWVDILTAAAEMKWEQIQTGVTAWLQSEGLA